MFIFNKKKIDKRLIAFSAKEAEKRTQEQRRRFEIEEDEFELELIFQNIRRAICRGEMSIGINIWDKAIIGLLEDLGYEVSYIPKSKDVYRISWRGVSDNIV